MPAPASPKSRANQLLLGLLFGFIFGFLLQKGGVGKFHILIGQLLFEDWTVVKVMTSAILVGMLGIYAMHRMGMVELHLKPTRVGANIIGGLVFGAGFGLSAYCPGTNLTALGQGNWDALLVTAGLLVGSYLFAELSGVFDRTIEKWGALGKKTLPEVIHVRRSIFVPIFAIVLVGVLLLVERFGPR